MGAKTTDLDVWRESCADWLDKLPELRGAVRGDPMTWSLDRAMAFDFRARAYLVGRTAASLDISREILPRAIG